MNRWLLNVLPAALGLLQAACPGPPPSIDSFSVTPVIACPGAVLLLEAKLLNAAGFDYQFTARDFVPSAGGGGQSILQIGDVSSDVEDKAHETRLCARSVFCVEILDASGAVIQQSCQVVNPDLRERENDRLTFVPDCPGDPTDFRPVDIAEDDPAGAQVVAGLRNLSRYDVILTHVGLDGIPVEERADAGQPFTELIGRDLYGSWSVEVVDDRFIAERQKCREEGEIIVPPFVEAEALEMDLRVRCGDDSPACPVVRP